MTALNRDRVLLAALGSGVAARFRLLAAVWTVLVVSGCGQAAGPPQQNPQASSTRSVRIFGTAAPDLSLRILTRWLSASEDCRQAENLFRRLDGKTAPGTAWVESPVVRQGETYEAHIPMDHFEPGACGWHPFVIAFQVTNAEGVSTGHFEAAAGGGRVLVPGPQELVWIDSPQGRAAQRGEPRPRGQAFVRPLELVCAENRIRGARGLSCVPVSPRELVLISEEAEEVQVDFRSGAPMW